MNKPSAILLAALLATGLHAEDKAANKSKGKDKAPAADAQAPSPTGLESIGTMIPEGLRNLKVRVPGFDNGRATSLVIADAMTRVSTNNLFAEGVVIHLFSVDPKDNIRVDLITATYEMDTKILSSKDRSKVARADFTVEGDSMEFDTASSHGKMAGHVHTVILDTSSLAPKKPEAPLPKAVPVSPPSPPAADVKPSVK